MPGEVQYTERELRTMQQEAIRRVQEMQRRSRQTVSRSGTQNRSNGQRPSQQHPAQGHTSPASSSHSPDSQSPPPAVPLEPIAHQGGGSESHHGTGAPASPSAETHSHGIQSLLPFSLNRVIQMNNPISTLLEAFHIDHDRLIILFVMMMVLGEGADTTLLLALVYLLL